VKTVPWSDILESATRAAAPLTKYLPPPVDLVADLALGIAAAVLENGCELGDDCPADVKADLARTPIPTGEGILSARMRAIARVRGLGK
jgi:hypothetical protein